MVAIGKLGLRKRQASVPTTLLCFDVSLLFSGYTSPFFGDWSQQTPAMQEVLSRVKSRQIASTDEDNTDRELMRSASLLPAKVVND